MLLEVVDCCPCLLLVRTVLIRDTLATVHCPAVGAVPSVPSCRATRQHDALVEVLLWEHLLACSPG